MQLGLRESVAVDSHLHSLACFQPSLFCVLQEMVRLLDALGDNLAAEQKELARQDFVLFRQLLTPIQVCKYSTAGGT